MKARCIVFRPEKDASYGRYVHMNGHVAHVANDPCGFATNGYGPDGEIEAIMITSQGSDHDSRLYAWELGFRAHNKTTLEESEKAVALLKPIDRKLRKMYETEGNAASFGAWVNRIARAIGAESIIIWDDTRKEKTGQGWRTYSIGNAVSQIDYDVAALIEWANELKRAA